jgi:hypothetical protein
MMSEDYNRIGFKEILDILDPNLASDFKQSSYYHNEFKVKTAKRSRLPTANGPPVSAIADGELAASTAMLMEAVTIADPTVDTDNYM